MRIKKRHARTLAIGARGAAALLRTIASITATVIIVICMPFLILAGIIITGARSTAGALTSGAESIDGADAKRQRDVDVFKATLAQAMRNPVRDDGGETLH